MDTYASALFRVEDDGSLKLAADLMPQQVGTSWVGVSYDWRKAVILPKNGDNWLIVLDFDKAAVVKRCEILETPENGHLNQRLADPPREVRPSCGSLQFRYAWRDDPGPGCPVREELCDLFACRGWRRVGSRPAWHLGGRAPRRYPCARRSKKWRNQDSDCKSNFSSLRSAGGVAKRVYQSIRMVISQ